MGTDPPNGLATAEWKLLGRIADGRVHQFWDPKHVVSAELMDRAIRTPPQPKPDCCVQKGHYWDEAILYPAGTRWKDASTSLFWNGPVVRIVPSLENSLSEVRR